MMSKIYRSPVKLAVSALALLLMAASAYAQPNFVLEDTSGPIGGTADMRWHFENTDPASVCGIDVCVFVPDTQVTSVDLANCFEDVAEPHASSTFSECAVRTTGSCFTDPSVPAVPADTTVVRVALIDFGSTIENGGIPEDAAGRIGLSLDPGLSNNDTFTVEAHPVGGAFSDCSGTPVTPDVVQDATITAVELSAVLNVTPASIPFPDTQNGSTSASQSFTIENDGSDGVDMQVTGVSLTTGTHFSISPNTCSTPPFTLSDGQSCTYDAVFSPQAIGNFNDTVTVTSDAGQVTNDQVALSGEGTSGPAANLVISDSAHDYGDVLTGDSATFTFTVTNGGEPGSEASIDTITPPAGEFSVTGGSCNPGSTTLANGENCTIDLEFAPTSDGPQSGDLVVDGTDTVNTTSLQVSSAVEGNGVTEARFASSPSTGGVNMGLTAPGGSLSQIVTVSNEGNANLNVDNCVLDNPDGLFSIDQDPLNLTIAPDESADFTVSCDVPEPGLFSATLTCDTNDADNDPVSYTFTCNGQVLEVPTMQPWGLVTLTLIMLMIGGLSIRYFRA